MCLVQSAGQPGQDLEGAAVAQQRGAVPELVPESRAGVRPRHRPGLLLRLREVVRRRGAGRQGGAGGHGPRGKPRLRPGNLVCS